MYIYQWLVSLCETTGRLWMHTFHIEPAHSITVSQSAHCDCAIKKNQQSDYTRNNSLHKDIFSEMDSIKYLL